MFNQLIVFIWFRYEFIKHFKKILLVLKSNINFQYALRIKPIVFLELMVNSERNLINTIRFL